MVYGHQNYLRRLQTLKSNEGLKITFSLFITGLSTGVYPGNSDFNASDKPKFIEAFILTICLNLQR